MQLPTDWPKRQCRHHSAVRLPRCSAGLMNNFTAILQRFYSDSIAHSVHWGRGLAGASSGQEHLLRQRPSVICSSPFLSPAHKVSSLSSSAFDSFPFCINRKDQCSCHLASWYCSSLPLSTTTPLTPLSGTSMDWRSTAAGHSQVNTTAWGQVQSFSVLAAFIYHGIPSRNSTLPKDDSRNPPSPFCLFWRCNRKGQKKMNPNVIETLTSWKFHINWNQALYR